MPCSRNSDSHPATEQNSSSSQRTLSLFLLNQYMLSLQLCIKRLSVPAMTITSRQQVLSAQPYSSSSSSSPAAAAPRPPSLLKKHKRQVTSLERAAAIGLEALQESQQQQHHPQQLLHHPQQQWRRQQAPAAAAAMQGPLADDSLLQPSQHPQQRPKKRVGALQKVPVIPPADEMATSALKRSMRVNPGAGIKNEAEKERSRAAKQLDTHMKELSVPLTRWVKAFPAMSSLHPFEAALLDLTVGQGTYASVLGKVDTLRKALQEVGKSSANRASKAANKKAATAAAEEGSAALSAVFAKGAKTLEDLRKMSRSLRTLPYVEPTLPTLALVGAPNVGKSSLVRLLSSGVPEVCNYPFTTRSIKMGHFYIDANRHQVMDTPGLLERPDDFRNKMELLTLAALQHLPSSVMFVADLTEECGTSVSEQWLIRQELKQRFPDKPWVDVLSKADLLEDVWQAAGAAAAGTAGIQPDQQQLDQQQRTGQQEEVVVEVQDAVQFAAALPHAVRVSSVTEAGFRQLQEELVSLLKSPAALAQLAAAAAADAEAAAAEEEGGGAGEGLLL